MTILAHSKYVQEYQDEAMDEREDSESVDNDYPITLDNFYSTMEQDDEWVRFAHVNQDNIMNEERKRLELQIIHSLSLFQNVTQQTAIIALQSLVNKKIIEKHTLLLRDWHIYDHIILLRKLFQNLTVFPSDATMQDHGVHQRDAQWVLQTFNKHRLKMINQIQNEQTSYDYMRQAMLLRFEFKPYKANECFKRSIELNPHSYESIYSRAMIALRLNRPIDYLKQLNLALFVCEREIALMQLRPAWFDVGIVTRASSFRHSIRGRIFIKRKQYAKSLKEYEQAINIDPKSMYAHFYLGFYYSFEGRDKVDDLSTRHFIEALKYTGVERRDVYASLIYDNLGQVFENSDRFEEALQFYTKALEANPRYGWGYQNRALLLPEMNRYEQAVDDNTNCINFEPEMKSMLSDLYAERARAHFNLGETVKCKQDLEQAKKLDPTLEYPYVMLSYLEANDEEKALKYLEEGIENCRGESADLLSVLGRKYWFYTTVVQDPEKANEAKSAVERFEKSHFRIE